ncbi:mannose-1-phosphate guanylyltransferase 1 [Oxobacter pfennigii]|uniref:mannose-1-phosphate guanylyltransferase n=1 Tax=Oxobacter pfennigii TaxID=36849 RepID=A0A0P8W6P1_9CLOT|nr:mannose-1-phosphate guanylyltransferase 1 [Oxobacter pfennigii]
MLHAVIMAGGRGERFWPESRLSRPKQFLNLLGNETMIQSTVRRINRLIPCDNIYIITNEMYKELVKEQLPTINEENIIVEPVARNTAACIGLACAFIKKKDKHANMVVLPSDHLIKDEDRFLNMIELGFKKANLGENLVTLGIWPNYPETAYGYIKIGNMDEDLAFNVERFVEKPDAETANKYINEGKYLWNSGMFIWHVDTIMKNFEIHMPKLFDGILNIEKAIGTGNQNHAIKEEFIKLDSISIDYGIMEKAKNIYVLPCQFGWDDVGSWTSLERLDNCDDEGNVLKGNVISLDTHRCIVKGSGKLIATVGIDDLIVVETEDAILICKKDKAQDIKQLIGEMKELSLDSYL